jgi:uncharacterized caspase-like protein
MRGAAWIGLLATFVFLGWVQPALADKRVALVIGNGAYQNATQLPNPPRDADAIAELFRIGGFDVVQSRLDLGNVEFKRALRELNLAAINADIAVVFFAGHGIEINGVNYLLPVDAKLKRDFDVEDEAVTLDRILRAVEPAKKLRLVVLDACRENPFVRTVQRTAAIRSVVNGLGKVEPTMSDTLIAYAAKAGSYSDDGAGTNSPFTTALLKHLMEPELDVRLALGRVRDEVLKRTRNQQEPFVYGSLGGTSVSLVAAPSAPKAPPPEEVMANYEMAERINTKTAWEAFLRTYKTGYHVDLARERLRLLQDAAAATKKTEEEAAAKAQPEARAKARQEEERIDAEQRAREVAEPTRVASAPMLTSPTQNQQASSDPSALIHAVQTELRRVRCDPGAIDGNWGPKAKDALAQFARHAKIELKTNDAPTEAVLQQLLAKKERVCPLQCKDDEVERGDKCVPRQRTIEKGPVPATKGVRQIERPVARQTGAPNKNPGSSKIRQATEGTRPGRGGTCGKLMWGGTSCTDAGGRYCTQQPGVNQRTCQ